MTTVTVSTNNNLNASVNANTVNGTKGQRIIYWIFTILIVLPEGVGSLWYNSQMSIDGMTGLGMGAEWFRHVLGIGKIVGALLLALPFIPVRFKEWAYVGFGISMICAAVGNFYVGDKEHMMGGFMAIVFFIFLLISYIYFHKTSAKGTFNK